jgi:pimeloyl-ACP methyl ester carboxylesterase
MPGVNILRAIRFIFITIFGLAVLLIAVSVGYRAFLQSSLESRTKIESSNGIESLEKISLNGSEQWIYIRGHNQDNPVLLFLHGGPGAPELPAARVFGLEIEKHFTVVHWDQRASGKSHREVFEEEDLSLETYLKDTLTLVNALRERFSKDKIFLIGHSWGTVLGTLTVRDHPELFHAYIGMGQVVNMVENEHLSLEFTIDKAREDKNEEALTALLTLNPPYADDTDELNIQRQWLYYYGGGMRGTTYPELAGHFLSSPEYSWLDLVAMFKGMLKVANHMWPELSQVDFFTSAVKLDVPVYFFTGRYDYNTPFALVEEYVELLEAPHKEIVWFEESSHFMNVSDPDHFQDMLISKVLHDIRQNDLEQKDTRSGR